MRWALDLFIFYHDISFSLYLFSTWYRRYGILAVTDMHKPLFAFWLIFYAFLMRAFRVSIPAFSPAFWEGSRRPWYFYYCRLYCFIGFIFSLDILPSALDKLPIIMHYFAASAFLYIFIIWLGRRCRRDSGATAPRIATTYCLPWLCRHGLFMMMAAAADYFDNK